MSIGTILISLTDRTKYQVLWTIFGFKKQHERETENSKKPIHYSICET